MKRFALLTLTLALALCLSACGGGRPDDPLLFLPAEKDGLYLTDRGTASSPAQPLSLKERAFRRRCSRVG